MTNFFLSTSLQDLDGEIWKPYNESLLVSNLGRVKALPSFSKNGKKLSTERVKNQHNFNGYRFISISKKSIYVHRMVAKAFIENPLNNPVVNHLNGIKHDNRVENLEWCTRSENDLHAFKIGLRNISELTRQKASNRGKMRNGGKNTNAKKIINTKTKEIYECALFASKATNVTYCHFIKMLKGHCRNTSCFEYLDKFNNK